MTITIRHKLASAVTDAQATGYIKPSNWNDTHDISLAANSLLGNPTNAPTYAQEIGISSDFAYSGSDLVLSATGIAAGPYTNANVTVDAKGRITTIANGSTTGGATAASHYILDTADATLPNARVLTDATAITWNESVAGQVKAILGQFTGDVTNASTDSLALTIGANKVTRAMQAQGTALTVIGRSANSTGNVADISATAASDNVFRESGSALGFGSLDLSKSGTVGSSRLALANVAQGSARSVLGVTGNATADHADIQGTADQVLVVNGAGTALAFGTVATGGITAAAVTYAKIQNVAGLSVVARSANSSGVAADVTGTTDQVLRVDTSGTTLGFGTIATGGITAAAVTYAKIQNIAGLSVMGRSTNSSGVGADITGTANQFLQVNSGGTALAFVTMGTDATLSGGALTIANSAVTFAKMQNSASAGLSVIGRSTNSAGVFAEINAASDNQVLRRSGTAVGFGAIDVSQSNAVTGVLQAASVPVLSGAIAAAGGTATTTSTITLLFIIGDGSNTISTGVTGNWAMIDFACTIVQWSILAHESGSISIDVWKTTESSFDSGATHPVAADKISASAPITFTTATKAQSSTLTGWTTSVSANDVLAFNVASVTTCKQVVISLKVTKTS